MKIPAQYAKFITAAVGLALQFALWKYGGGNQWVTLAVAVASALGVYAVPNADKPTPPAPPAG